MYKGVTTQGSIEILKKLDDSKNLLNSMGEKVEIPNNVSYKCVRSLLPRQATRPAEESYKKN